MHTYLLRGSCQEKISCRLHVGLGCILLGPGIALQTLSLSAFLRYKTLIYSSPSGNGLVIAGVKQLNTFPVHKILYTNNEDQG